MSEQRKPSDNVIRVAEIIAQFPRGLHPSVTAPVIQREAVEPAVRPLVEALAGVLDFEATRAKTMLGLSDCGCMMWSRETENAYENNNCVHQLGHDALASWRHLLEEEKGS